MFIKQRSKSRSYLVQALYTWAVAEKAPAEIEKEFFEDFDVGNMDVDYFKALLKDIPARSVEIETALTPCLSGRNYQEIEPVEKAILQLAAYELLLRHDVPYRVVINEAIELTKNYGSNEGYGFVNAVLDKLAHTTRSIEMKAARRERS